MVIRGGVRGKSLICNMGNKKFHKVLYKVLIAIYSGDLFGGIAQLGERLHGMQEVIGSIPFTSTKDSKSAPNSRHVVKVVCCPHRLEA